MANKMDAYKTELLECPKCEHMQGAEYETKVNENDSGFQKPPTLGRIFKLGKCVVEQSSESSYSNMLECPLYRKMVGLDKEIPLRPIVVIGSLLNYITEQSRKD